MKENVRETVRLLIEKAVGSDNEDEARNAAVQACRLIHRYGLLNAAPLRYAVEPLFEDAGSLEELFASMGFNTPRSRPPQPHPPAPTPPQPTVPSPTRRADPNAKLVPIVDNRAYCGSCGQRIQRGKFALWSRGVFYHPTCFNGGGYL